MNILNIGNKSSTIPVMLRDNQSGGINALLLPLLAVIFLFIAALGFGIWSFSSRQDYKNNTDQKVQVAVDAAVKTEDAKKAAEYAEAAKNPLKTFIGPSDYGSIHVSYPKTWSAYVDETGNGNTVLDSYFYPDFVPSTNSGSSNTPIAYALHMQILNQTYSQVLNGLSSTIQGGTLTSAPYTLPKMPKVVGTILTGQIDTNINGVEIVLPLRDKTIVIRTEASQFLPDFKSYVLPSVTFSP